MDRPRALLVTILLGNTVANAGFALLTAGMIGNLRGGAEAALGGGGAALSALIGLGFVFIIIVVGEVAPKTIAIASARRIAPLIAPVVALLVTAAAPVRFLLEPLIRLVARPPKAAAATLGRDDLEMLVTVSGREGVLDSDEQDLILEILELGVIRARDVMVPRVDLLAMDRREPPSRLREFARERRLSDLLIHDGDLDRILGVLETRDLFVQHDEPIGRLLRPVVFVPQSATLENVLRQLRAAGGTVAVVLDEYFATDGIVTLEQIIEQIVGEVTVSDAPREPAGDVTETAPGVFDLPGDLSLFQWNDRFSQLILSTDFSTVAGYVLSVIGRLPREGDSVTHEGVRLTVTRVDRRRIARLRAETPAARAPEPLPVALARPGDEGPSGTGF